MMRRLDEASKARDEFTLQIHQLKKQMDKGKDHFDDYERVSGQQDGQERNDDESEI